MKYKTILASFALGAILVSPISTFAAGDFCSAIDTESSKITEKIDARKDKIAVKATERSEKLSSHFIAMEEAMAVKESAFEAKKSEMYAHLDDKADTDVEVSAVEAFKASVNAAYEARSESVSSAQDSYTDSVTALSEDRNDEIDAVVGTFESSVDSAISEAQASCDAGTPANEVRNEFKSDMKDAKDTLNASVEGFSGIRDDIKALHDAFKSSVQSANETFTSSVEEAKNTLKLAIDGIAV